MKNRFLSLKCSPFSLNSQNLDPAEAPFPLPPSFPLSSHLSIFLSLRSVLIFVFVFFQAKQGRIVVRDFSMAFSYHLEAAQSPIFMSTKSGANQSKA